MPNPFQSVAYLQVRRGWLGIQVMTWAGRTGAWSGAPDVLLIPDVRGRSQAYALDDPRVMNAVHARPFTAFTHPRVVFDEFEKTELALGVYLRKAGWHPAKGRWMFLFHLQDEWLAPLTELEQRALTELGRRLRSRNVLIVTASRELTVPEVLQLARGPRPPAGGHMIDLRLEV